MFTDSLTTDDALVEKLQPHASVQVELMDDQENEVVGNNVPDNVPNTVQQSPPVSQSVCNKRRIQMYLLLFASQREIVDLQII